MIFKLFALILLTSTVHTSDISSSIVNGEDARIQDFPYMAKVWLGPLPMCGGSIISPRSVLTAAHCFTDFFLRPALVSVVVGSSFRDGRLGGQRYRALRTEIHPGYTQDDFTLMYDVAVVRTINQIQYNTRVQPIEVSSFYVDVGVFGTVNGWGFTRQGAVLPDFADRLQTMPAMTIPDIDCYNSLSHDQRSQWLNEQNICVISTPGTSVCGGDSGGPLVLNNRVAGIVSWRLRECGDGTPDVFVRTSSVYDWIQKFL